MNLIFGKEKSFVEFVSNLNEKDRIAILAHHDTDGMVSAILAANSIGNPEFIEFFEYKKDLLLDIIPELKKSKINKLVCLDLNVENEADNLKRLEKFADSVKPDAFPDYKKVLLNFQVPQKPLKFLATPKPIKGFADILIIDHHRSSRDLNSLKTTYLLFEKGDCAAFACYNLFSKFQSMEKFDLLTAIALVSDYGFQTNMDFILRIEKKYGLMPDKVMWESEIGKLTKMIINVCIYFKDELKKLFEMLNRATSLEEIKKLEKYSFEVEKEIQKKQEEYFKKRETYDWGYLYEVKSKFSIEGILINRVSDIEKSKLVVIYGERSQNLIKISARRQDGKLDCSEVLKKAIEGLKDASAGGHIPAAGAEVRKEDIEKFKDNLKRVMGSK